MAKAFTVPEGLRTRYSVYQQNKMQVLKDSWEGVSVEHISRSFLACDVHGEDRPCSN